MDEKKLERVQNLNDERLGDVSGGARVPLERSRVVVIDADDGVRSIDGQLDRSVAGIPHIPIIKPGEPAGPGGSSDSW